MNEEFLAGERVIVCGEGYTRNPRRLGTVARFIQLTDGTKWTLQGYPYPRQQWARSHVSHATPEAIEEVRLENARARAWAKILNSTPEQRGRVPLEFLEEIVRALQSGG